MKKINTLLLLSLVTLVGCGSNTSTTSSSSSKNTVTSSSSVSSNSVVSSNSSNSSNLSNSTVSSSSTIDMTGWISKGSESDAVAKPNNWFYDANVTPSLAMEYEGELYFNYDNTNVPTAWNSVALFYHDNSLRVGNGYKLQLSVSSTKAGFITICGQKVEVKDGTIDFTIENVLEENKAAIAIYFGSEDEPLNGAIDIVIGSVKISKKANALDIINEALEAKNYTISMSEEGGMNGYYVTSKFFENAAHFSWGNSIDGTSGQHGFAENSEGVFSFSVNEGTVQPGSKYLEDLHTTENLKGLYTSAYEFTFSGLEGLPSLHKLDLSQFDYDLETGKKVRIKDGSSAKAFSFMLDEFYSTYYYGGVVATDITLLEGGALEIAIRTRMGDYSRFVLSNIGTTEDAVIQEFIGSENFRPAIDEEIDYETDPVVQSMLDDIALGNYTINKADGTKFYMNEKYSYSEDSEGNVKGYVKLDNGIFQYFVEEGKVVLGEDNYQETWNINNIYELDGLNSSNVNYFKDATKYTYNEIMDIYEMIPTGSFYSFSTKWFNEVALSIDLITLEKNDSNINIGALLSIVDDLGEITSQEMRYLEVSNIGNTSNEFMESYLESIK